MKTKIIIFYFLFFLFCIQSVFSQEAYFYAEIETTGFWSGVDSVAFHATFFCASYYHEFELYMENAENDNYIAMRIVNQTVLYKIDKDESWITLGTLPIGIWYIAVIDLIRYPLLAEIDWEATFRIELANDGTDVLKIHKLIAHTNGNIDKVKFKFLDGAVSLDQLISWATEDFSSAWFRLPITKRDFFDEQFTSSDTLTDNFYDYSLGTNSKYTASGDTTFLRLWKNTSEPTGETEIDAQVWWLKNIYRTLDDIYNGLVGIYFILPDWLKGIVDLLFGIGQFLVGFIVPNASVLLATYVIMLAITSFLGLSDSLPETLVEGDFRGIIDDIRDNFKPLYDFFIMLFRTAVNLVNAFVDWVGHAIPF